MAPRQVTAVAQKWEQWFAGSKAVHLCGYAFCDGDPRSVLAARDQKAKFICVGTRCSLSITAQHNNASLPLSLFSFSSLFLVLLVLVSLRLRPRRRATTRVASSRQWLRRQTREAFLRSSVSRGTIPPKILVCLPQSPTPHYQTTPPKSTRSSTRYQTSPSYLPRVRT